MARFYEIQQREFIESGDVERAVPVGQYVLLDNMVKAGGEVRSTLFSCQRAFR